MDVRVEAVQRMQDYIAAHLTEAITLADLARAACYSPWYAARLFRELTGLSPAEYIRRCRLTCSARRIKAGDCSVTDAAMDTGFGSVDGYQRAFRRAFGVNPGEYRATHQPIGFFTPYGVKYREPRKETISMEHVTSVFIQKIHKPARRAVIRRGVKADNYFDYCEEVGCEIWGLLESMDSLCGEPVCLWLPDALRLPGTSVYVQGVEIPAAGDAIVPEGFDVIALPEADYLQFQGEPFREEDYCQAIEGVQWAMDRFNPALQGLRWDDSQPRIQLEPRGERGYIELRAVKEK